MDKKDKLFKVFNGEIKDIDAKANTLTALVSTDAVDRMGEVLDPDGVKMANYKKNPIVLFGHQYDQPPIGKAQWIKKTAQGIMAKVEFAKSAFAQEIFELYKGGFMRAFSVGFIPNYDKIETNDGDDAGWGKKKPRRKYLEWELLEFSAVPVPANPEALALAVSKGVLKSDALREWMAKSKNEDIVVTDPPAVVKEDPETTQAVKDGEDAAQATLDKIGEPAIIKDVVEEVPADIKLLQEQNEAKEKEINNLKYKLYLVQSKPAGEKSLPEMTVGEVKHMIAELVNGVIRKAQGKVD